MLLLSLAKVKNTSVSVDFAKDISRDGLRWRSPEAFVSDGGISAPFDCMSEMANADLSWKNYSPSGQNH